MFAPPFFSSYLLNTHLLAIIIPAYKGEHLRQCLESFAAQPCRDFALYVFDDASPDNIEGIVDDFIDRLPLTYQRFEINLGGTSLVAQWARCVALTSEPWIWLFGDDDEIEFGCVEHLLEALREPSCSQEILRFDNLRIGGAGEILGVSPLHPEEENFRDLLAAYFSNETKRVWAAPDHVFSRSVYLELGGFVEFPCALYSDYATWALFASKAGIRTLRGPRVRLRKHKGSISSNWEKHLRDYILAGAAFVRWIATSSQLDLAQAERTRFSNAAKAWYIRLVANATPAPSPALRALMWEQIRLTWPASLRFCSGCQFWYIRLKVWARWHPWFGWLSKLKRSVRKALPRPSGLTQSV